MIKHLIATGCLCLGLLQAYANPFSIKPDGLWFNEGDFSAQLSAVAVTDTLWFSSNPQNVKGDTNLGRFQTGQYLNFGTHWQLDFIERWKEDNKLHLALFNYTGKGFDFGIGQATPPFGLNNSNTLEDVPFVQFNLPDLGFAPDPAVGIFPIIYNDHWVFQGAAAEGRWFEHYKNHQPFIYSGRLFYAPFHTAKHVLHLELSFFNLYPDGSHTASYNATPEANTASSATFIDTGTINNVNNTAVGELAAGYENGAFNAIGAYMLSHVKRYGGEPNLNFNGYYVTLSYFLTGESRDYLYPDGFFANPTHIKHRYGAFELTGRVSQLDLIDQDVKGGKELNTTLGMNWFFTPQILARINWIHVWNRQPTTSQRAQFNIAALEFVIGAY